MTMTIDKLTELLPHRYPFLLIDRVDELAIGDHVTARKNVTVGEPFFVGHFPDTPVMPGVLMVEAMAQAGGLLFHTSDLAVLAGLDSVRFRKRVVPGDVLIIRARNLGMIGSLGKVDANASVDGVIAASAKITYGFVRKDML